MCYCLVGASEEEFITTGFRNWKNATGSEGKLEKHVKSRCHSLSHERFTTAQSCSRDPSRRVDVMFGEENKRLLAQTEAQRIENRDAVGTIIDCVRFLAKQELAFRDHDESSASNRGNFLELVHFLAKYNPPLQHRLDKHPGNASYLSPDIQNQLIKILYETTVDVIKTEAAEAQYFGVEADEVSNTTGKEFISIILRYVSGYKIMERLVGLVRVSDMSGKGLSNIWKARLDAIGVKLTSIVGQCYDGASNMSGEYRGVQAETKREAGDRAVYTHCYNHVLALVLERSASDIPLVVQVSTWLNTAYKFLKHYKVIVIYDEMLKQNNLTGQYKMQSLSETRWFARSRNLDIAVNAHGLLVDLCDKVMNETKVTEGTKAILPCW